MFNFGKRLKQIRKEHNLTQKQLADLIGGTERSIQNYEAGDRKPTFDVILAISMSTLTICSVALTILK